MVKYHINQKTGRPNVCRATVRDCPIKGQDGNPVRHYLSIEDARIDYEKEMAKHQFNSLKKSQSHNDVSSTESLRKTIKDPESFNSRFFKEGLINYYGVDAEIEYPGCEGCETGTDYCRCSGYTGGVEINPERLVASYYNKVLFKEAKAYPNTNKGDDVDNFYFMSNQSFEKTTPEAAKAVETITEIFNKHGMFDSINYRAIGEPDYYGEILKEIECYADVDSAMRELKEIYAEK